MQDEKNKELVCLRSSLDHAESPGLQQMLLSVGVSDPPNSFQQIRVDLLLQGRR